VADPPWRYTQSGRIPSTGKRRGAAAEDHYPTMTNAELAALPVADLADQSAHLYLWVTNPRLFGERQRGEMPPVDIAAAWDFRYVTLLTWVKRGALGMGFYWRGNTEHVLFCVRGDAPIAPERRLVNIIDAPKSRHSAKPDAFYDLVEQVSQPPRLELFARRQRFGWDTWGNEALPHIDLSEPAA
jgi:N6-adenosine-specific RNA methylase IME4